MMHQALAVCGILTAFSLVSVGAQPFDDCNVDDYYESINLQDRNALHTLIQSTHRNVVPYTSSSSLDVWDALIELDGRDTDGDGMNDEVLLVYANTYIPANDYGTSTTWNREHLWPKSLGVGTEGADFSDVHHLRPSDWNVNAARGNKWFGECGVVDVQDDCEMPAHDQAADDTETDNIVWLPPSSQRGDIARALFYMEMRYEGDRNNELDLVLTNCPSTGDETELGYLSQLLTWHQEDPVDDAERERNQAVCESWQGNRNPFIDHPELVSVHFGAPQEANPPTGYECSTDPSTDNNTTDNDTMPPTTTEGTCNGLQAGHVMVMAFNSDNPDEVVIVALTDLMAGASFFLTDNAWTGTKFRTNEGTLKFVVPDSGISALSVIGFGNSSYPYASDWQEEQGSFALAASGDTLLLYCVEEDDSSSVTHLSALSYSGDWLVANTDETSFDTQHSALPSTLPSNTHVALAHKDNYWYIGPRQGSMSELLEALSDPSMWQGSDAERFVLGANETSFSGSAATFTQSSLFQRGVILVAIALSVLFV